MTPTSTPTPTATGTPPTPTPTPVTGVIWISAKTKPRPTITPGGNRPDGISEVRSFDAYINLTAPNTNYGNAGGLNLDARSVVQGPYPYTYTNKSAVISFLVDDVPPMATPIAARLHLARDAQCPGCATGNNFPQYVLVRSLLTDFGETAVTWTNPWQIAGAYGDSDVSGVRGLYIVPVGTPVPPPDTEWADIDVLNVIEELLVSGTITDGIRLKLEPYCVPNQAGNCFTFTNWSSREGANPPRLSIEWLYTGPTPTPDGTPLPTSTPIPTATPTSTATATATPTGVLPTATPTPTPVPGLVISEILVNPAQDWNGDGEINERDRFVEVCNWTAATIDFQDEYWLRFNGLRSDKLNGKLAAGQCFVAWYLLTGSNFLLAGTGGQVTLEYINASVPVDSVVYPRVPDGLCLARWPDGSSSWVQHRCSPGQSNGYFLVNPTPTATP